MLFWLNFNLVTMRRVGISVLICLVTICCSSQKIDSSWTRAINLPGDAEIKQKKRIELVTADSFVVVSTQSLIINHLKKKNEQGVIEADRLLLDRFLDRSSTLEEIMLDIITNPLLRSRMDFCTSEMLQQGKCVLYNKIAGRVESKVMVTNYIKDCGRGIRFSTVSGVLLMDLAMGGY